ncbi:hypothetical protein ABZW10_33085 [Kitasatospora sp. NPDC004723]|uniref:hypothetical protein n=1 Tax=Kitasatospora sp. NPDC004723 TaxID=3154288 RepID=UPI0033AAF87D
MASVLCLFGGGIAAVHAFVRREFGRLAVGIGLCLVAVAIVSAPVRRTVGDLFGEILGTSSDPAPQAPAPAGDTGLHLGAWWWVIGGAVVTVAAGAALWRKLSNRSRRHTRDRARWDAITAEHDQVREEYGLYVADPFAVLDRPALADVTVPQTIALLHALDAAADAARGTDPAAYREAVTSLKLAWAAADGHARKLGVEHLPKQERATVGRARALLTTALDGGGNEHERRAAYEQARKLLDGVIVLPRQATAELESRQRLSLAKPETPAD